MRSSASLPGWVLKEKALTKDKVKGWSKKRKIAAFAQGPQRIERTLRKFPRKMWGFTTTPKNWCIKEVLWHLADQEANLYVRLRRAGAESGGLVSSYDQEKWSAKLLYKKADPLQAKALLLLLRQANSDLVKRLPSKVWKAKVKHPDYGMIAVGFMVGLNVWHLDGHLAQMGRRYNEWKSRQK